MKTTTSILIGLLLLCGYAFAAESPSMVNGLSVSPYYTVGFENFDGKATSGAGVDIGLNLSKTVQAVSFMEADDTTGSSVDRFGLGLQLTGKLGKWLRPYGRLSLAYAFDSHSSIQDDAIFLRPEFGVILDVWKKGNWHVGIESGWGLDVDTEGHAEQRFKAGVVVGTSF